MNTLTNPNPSNAQQGRETPRFLRCFFTFNAGVHRRQWATACPRRFTVRATNWRGAVARPPLRCTPALSTFDRNRGGIETQLRALQVALGPRPTRKRIGPQAVGRARIESGRLRSDTWAGRAITGAGKRLMLRYQTGWLKDGVFDPRQARPRPCPPFHPICVDGEIGRRALSRQHAAERVRIGEKPLLQVRVLLGTVQSFSGGAAK